MSHSFVEGSARYSNSSSCPVYSSSTLTTSATAATAGPVTGICSRTCACLDCFPPSRTMTSVCRLDWTTKRLLNFPPSFLHPPLVSKEVALFLRITMTMKASFDFGDVTSFAFPFTADCLSIEVLTDSSADYFFVFFCFDFEGSSRPSAADLSFLAFDCYPSLVYSLRLFDKIKFNYTGFWGFGVLGSLKGLAIAISLCDSETT